MEDDCFVFVAVAAFDLMGGCAEEEEGRGFVIIVDLAAALGGGGISAEYDDDVIVGADGTNTGGHTYD